MFANSNQKAACGFLCASFIASFAFGHGGGGDIALYDINGKVGIGFATLDDEDEQQLSFDPTDKVFQAILTPLVGQPPFIPWELGSTEPGFDANEGELLAAAEVSWNVQSIKHWDGSGEVAFSSANDVEGGYAPQPAITDSLGGFHEHPTFGLSDLTNDSQPIADGVYLTELTVSVVGQTESMEDSNPFYLVTLVDSVVNSQPDPVAAAEALGEAIRDYLDPGTLDPGFGAPTLDGKSFGFYAEAIQYAESLPVPEPGSAVLLALAIGAVAMRRR